MPSPCHKSYTDGVFSSTHQRYLVSRFRHIDGLLGNALDALDPHGNEHLFKDVRPDASPAQRKILADQLGQLRYALRRFMETQQLQEATSPVSGLWSLRTAVLFAQTAVAQLRPAYLRGYGELDPDASIACERLVAELTTLLQRISEYLDQGTEGDLAARLARLDGARGDIALLRELEGMITRHGILELRAPLGELIERAATPRYEVAVFGRVNSGKSSLLNWWLAGTFLPTGITPMTAVTTHIVYGEQARAHVQLASAEPRVVSLDELAAYVTEAGNPGNCRRVIAIRLEIPSRRLAEGIRLVDTPGLGSLATVGSAQTLEYLPRCDLAVQLIEAGAALGREDLELARMVLDSGSELLVVLSKADRIDASDLAEAAAYAAGQFHSALGVTVPMHPVSTVGVSTALAEAWFEQQLAPRLADHQARSTRQLGRKIEVLREQVSAALAARLRIPAGGTRPERKATDAAPDDLALQARVEIERARSDLRALLPRIRTGDTWIAEGLAEALTGSWMSGSVAAAGIEAQLDAAAVRRATAIGDRVADILARCRTALESLLRHSRAGGAESVLPQLRERPVFDSSALHTRIRTDKPAAVPRVGLLLRGLSRRRVRAPPVRKALAHSLAVFAEALRVWSSGYLEALSRATDAAVAAAESRSLLSWGEPLSPSAAAAAQRDLARLTSDGGMRAASDAESPREP